MLSYKLLKNHEGIVLAGDYVSLKTLHWVLHDVNERSPLLSGKESPFIGLAFDIRKAFEQEREIIPPPDGMVEIGTRFGVEVIWPVLLLQQRTFRASLAFMDHSRWHQAAAYALEAVIEDALKEDFGERGAAVVQAWQRLSPNDPGVYERLRSRGAIFSSWKKAERKRRFINLIESFDSMYEVLYRANPRESRLSPDELEAWADAEW